MGLFGVKSRYFVNDFECEQCHSTDIIRIKRHRMYFNHFIFTLWLLIPVAYIYKNNASYLWLLVSALALFFINSIILFFRIRKYRQIEKTEWLLFCLSCKDMGLLKLGEPTFEEGEKTENF